MGEVSRLGRDVVSRLVPGSRERFLVARVAGSVALQRCNCALCTAGALHHMTICSSEGRDNTG
jgi:ABC-type dipeptide/oligopeptide/nickel transport system permease subunit